MLSNPRVDCIIIWGHGMKYFDEILQEIEEDKIFEILKIIKHIPKSQKHLVREVYSFDYAPFNHLKSKTKYLLKMDKEVCFIFVKNLSPEEDFFGVGQFRHVESVTLKEFKEKLRDKFNPYENGVRTHNHVIHATDNQTQAHFLLKYLGYREGISIFNQGKKLFDFPNFITDQSSISIVEIDYDNILCNVVVGESWNSYHLEKREIKESPHFQSLSDGANIYDEYWSKFIGGPIKAYNSPSKFALMKSEFKYLKAPYNQSYIIVKKQNYKYLIVDGLHRAALHFYQGSSSIIACVIN